MIQASLLDWQPPAASYPDGIPADVCDLFEKLATQLRKDGFERFSADAILHRIRWEMRVERNNRAFLVNNNWSAPLARWFIKRNPTASKFFELRERISA